MTGNYYILVETENKEATFIQRIDEDFRFFEIFQLSRNVIFANKAHPESSSAIIVNAVSQQEALKKFGKNFPNLKKRSVKDYYEAALII